MLTQIINGKIFTPEGWMEEGSVLLRDDKILEVTNCDLAVEGAELVDARGMYIVPGYVCMNVHGAAGHDFSECTEDAFRSIVRAHEAHGATTIFPTIARLPLSGVKKGAEICEKLMDEPGTTIMGLHIKGPYLNPLRASHEYGDLLQKPNPDEYKKLVESTHCIKRWDASPEVEGALEFAKYLKSQGILAAISLTEAEFPLVKEAFESGFSHTALFYNGMPGFHKCREYKYEGTVESVYLMDDMTVEVVADGRHLPNTILRLVYKLKGVEKTCLVTAALAYAAAEGKEVDIPNVIVEDGVCKTKDHEQLAGSIATMDVLVKQMVKAGATLGDAIRMASETPAKVMNVFDRTGSLERDKEADVLILDEKFNVRAIWAKGRNVKKLGE